MIAIPGLAGIIQKVFPAGNLQVKALKFGKARLNEQSGRTAGKQLGHAAHKAISAVMGPDMPGTLEQRIAVGTALAESVNVQAKQFGESVVAFAAAAANRERNRTGSGVEAALEAREAAEEELEQDGIDIGRVLAGDDPSER